MEKRNVRFEDVQYALLWLLSHPSEKLYYDKFDNYVMFNHFSNVIEDWHYIDVDELDYDRLNFEEFINNFKGIVLQNYNF